MRADLASRKDHPGSAQTRAKDIYPEEMAGLALISAAVNLDRALDR
jgi:hypothetical protein